MLGGAWRVVWGSGRDQVDQRVGLSYFGPDLATPLANPDVRGQRGVLYRFLDSESDGDELLLSWTEDGCDRTVFLHPETTVEQGVDFASRF